MPAESEVARNELMGALLRSVSRSFFLSIRLLPHPLREPVGLAYLLARATDTVADSAEVPISIRKEQLQVLSDAIQNGDGSSELIELEQVFAPLQRNQSERVLILALPQCLQRLRRMDAEDARDIRVVLEKIARAQKLDVERFGDSTEIRALQSATELEEYVYLIAGCVGEFWTDICARRSERFAELPAAEMRLLGKQYGVGLQLINILRDAHGDLRVGRCYFPKDELEAAGLALADIQGHPAVFGPVFQKWLGAAEAGLRAGMKYVAAIQNRRIRAATALPALIGARTIALLRASGARALSEKIKVPRKEVRAILATVAITLARRATLEEMFRKNLEGN